MVGKQSNNGGRGDKGKEKNVLFQNTNSEQLGVKSLSVSSRNNRKESILGQREPLRVKISSESSRVNQVTCKDNTLGQREYWGEDFVNNRWD